MALAGALGFGFYVATLTHRRNMKALEVLRSYAERGVEPPSSIAEPLAAQIMDSDRGSKQWDREHLVRSFGFLFSACVIGGSISGWRNRAALYGQSGLREPARGSLGLALSDCCSVNLAVAEVLIRRKPVVD